MAEYLINVDVLSLRDIRFSEFSDRAQALPSPYVKVSVGPVTAAIRETSVQEDTASAILNNCMTFVTRLTQIEMRTEVFRSLV